MTTIAASRIATIGATIGATLPSADGLDPILDPNNPDLVVMYTMDNVSGTALVDESPNNNNGTNSGTTTFIAGKIGNSIQYGGGKFTVLPIFDLTSTAGAFSFFYRFKPVDLGVVNRIATLVSNDIASVSDGITLNKLADNTLRLNINSNGSNKSSFSSVLSADTWYFFVVQQTGSGTEIYLDSVFGQTGDATHLSWFADFNGTEGEEYALGAWPSIPLTEGTDFEVDQFRYFNRALTQPEIDVLFNGGAGA
jgi:hypothetical protein